MEREWRVDAASRQKLTQNTVQGIHNTVRKGQFCARAPAPIPCSLPSRSEVPRCEVCCCEPEAPNQPCCHLALVIGRVKLATRPTIGMDFAFHSFFNPFTLFFCHEKGVLFFAFRCFSFCPSQETWKFLCGFVGPSHCQVAFFCTTYRHDQATYVTNRGAGFGRKDRWLANRPCPIVSAGASLSFYRCHPQFDCTSPPHAKVRGQTDENAHQSFA